MRLNPRGEVVPCNYDFDTLEMGHIRTSIPIAYARPFFQASSDWTRHDLWKALVVREGAIASIIVNNVFLVVVTRESMFIQRNAEHLQPQIAAADVYLRFSPSLPIGFVRTCPEVKDVNIPPYLLYMDEYKRVSLGGGPLKTLSDAVPCSDIQLYKTLITTTHSAIYMSNSGPKYL